MVIAEAFGVCHELSMTKLFVFQHLLVSFKICFGIHFPFEVFGQESEDLKGMSFEVRHGWYNVEVYDCILDLLSPALDECRRLRVGTNDRRLRKNQLASTHSSSLCHKTIGIVMLAVEIDDIVGLKATRRRGRWV